MWRPTISLATLKQRAKLLADIRAFFTARNLLEVDVPVLSPNTVTDPHLQSIPAQVSGQQQFLQTSPEFYMKRLLAAGCGSCFCLGKAFRQDERGRRHRPEFTMLEWYRVGFDDVQLATDVTDLIAFVSGQASCERASYSDIFTHHLGINPHSATTAQLAALAADKLRGQADLSAAIQDEPEATGKSEWLDLLFSHCIEPHLQDPIVIFDYPECQCALAKIATDAKGQRVAKRFELFWKGMELANGYWELTDAGEQARRFRADQASRQQLKLPPVEPDARLLAALKAGLPDSAGVALGVDRLLMCLTGIETMDEVVLF